MTNHKQQGKAKKHHFVPECYLKGWAGPDGKIIEYRDRYQGVSPRWTAPGGTGYEPDLYSMPALGDRSAALEKQLMAMVDAAAATALFAMRNQESLDASAREAFAALLTTLLTRTPPSIHVLKQRLVEWRRKDRPEIQAIYDRFIRRPGMPARAADQFAESDTDEEVQAFIAETFAAIFTHVRIREFLTKMRWRVLTIPAAAPSLLTSDQPIVSSNGIDGKNGYLMLPIDPKRMFLATNSALFSNKFVQEKGLINLARQANLKVVGRARRFVFASDHSQQELIVAKFGKDQVETVGEKIAKKDPWGMGRPNYYSTDDAIADYVEWISKRVEKLETS